MEGGKDRPEFEWTLDRAPAESELHPASAAPDPGRRLIFTHSPRALRRMALVVATLAAVLGLTVYGVARAGWQRLGAQVTARVAEEDARSREKDARAVRAMQADPESAWAQLRADQAGQGLAAPLPAPHLLPLSEPAQVVTVETPSADLIHATVARSYADSAGAVFQFELVQRYYGPEPGVWLRLPPEPADFARLVTWRGGWIEVTFPEIDRPWMDRARPQIDQAAAAVCEDWGCPAGHPISSLLPPASRL